MPSPFSAETMKVWVKAIRSLREAARARRRSRGMRSILLRIRTFGRFTSGSLARIASTSSETPLRASMSRQTASASEAPLQAEWTMARSSRRFGAKMPGVSTRMICAAPSMTMPRTSARVVCTLRETMDTLVPTRLFRSVDLPALGMPMRATKPAVVFSGIGADGSGTRGGSSTSSSSWSWSKSGSGIGGISFADVRRRLHG